MRPCQLASADATKMATITRHQIPSTSNISLPHKQAKDQKDYS